MILPPSVVYIKIKDENKKGFGCWFPFFLLWPIFLLLLIIVIPISVLIDLILWVIGRKYHHYTKLILYSLNLISESKGLQLNVNDKESIVKIDI